MISTEEWDSIDDIMAALEVVMRSKEYRRRNHQLAAAYDRYRNLLDLQNAAFENGSEETDD